MDSIGVFIGGKQIIIPGVIPEVDTSAMTPLVLAGVRIPLLIGKSDGGDPGKIYLFRNFEDAKAILRSGSALSYLSRVFRPSPSLPGASLCLFIRAAEAGAQSSFSPTVG